MKAEKRVCPHTSVDIIEKRECYKVKGEAIEVCARVKQCKECGEEIFDFEYDTENLKKAYSIYRKKHNLLSSKEIVSLRKRYKLSQRAFAALIGCTQATIARYERGSVQDLAYNSVMQLMENPDNVQSLLDSKRALLDVKDAMALECILEENKKRSVSDKNGEICKVFDFLKKGESDVYTGFQKFNYEKFKAMVVFFAKHQSNLYKTKLMKLLWYADMVYFKNYVKSISGVRYIHQHYGPIPDNHDILLGVLASIGEINIEEHESQYGIGEVVKPNSSADWNTLDKNEVAVLKIVNDLFMDKSAKDISDLSHEEEAYQKTNMKECISFEYAMQLKAL